MLRRRIQAIVRKVEIIGPDFVRHASRDVLDECISTVAVVVPPENLREHVRVLPYFAHTIDVDAVVFVYQTLERSLRSDHRFIGNCILRISWDIEGTGDVDKNVCIAISYHRVRLAPLPYNGVDRDVFHHGGSVRSDAIPEGAFLGKYGGFVDIVGFKGHADLLEIDDV